MRICTLKNIFEERAQKKIALRTTAAAVHLPVCPYPPTPPFPSLSSPFRLNLFFPPKRQPPRSDSQISYRNEQKLHLNQLMTTNGHNGVEASLGKDCLIPHCNHCRDVYLTVSPFLFLPFTQLLTPSSHLIATTRKLRFHPSFCNQLLSPSMVLLLLEKSPPISPLT